MSLGGQSAPGGDIHLTGASTFANTHLHHNEPDSSPHNRALMGYGFGSPRDYVITRGPQSMDRGTPIVAGANGKVKVVGGSMNIIELYDPSGRKLARFLHNDRIIAKDGQTVGPNTIIATQGSAGGNWPVHVHLEGSPAFQTNWIKATMGNKNLADIQGGQGAAPSGSAPPSGETPSQPPEDPFATAQGALDEALKKWAAAFGGSATETASALTPSKSAPVQGTPSSTSAAAQVQTGSEQHASREATKPGTAAVVPVPMVAKAADPSPSPVFVKNTAMPTASVHK